MSSATLALSMKKIAIALCLAALTMGAPVTAGSSGGCDVLFDPAGDVGFIFEGDGVSNAIDLTGLRMAYDEDSLTVAVRVRNLTAPPSPGMNGASYEVGWRQGTERYTATAARRGGAGWFYDLRTPDGQTVEVEGARRHSTHEILMDVPLSVLAIEPGAELTEVRAWSSETMFGWGMGSDTAPNISGGAERFALVETCALSTAGLGETCVAVSAPATSPDEPPGARVRSVRFAAADETLIAEIAYDARDPDAEQRWDVSWSNYRLEESYVTQSAWVDRRGERVEFGFDGVRLAGSTTGSISDGVVRIVIPRQGLRLMDGVRITDVRAQYSEYSGTFGSSSDVLPATGEGGSWVVGATCNQAELQPCPIVTDRAGDAREIEATEDQPRNFDRLDLRGVGATPSADGMVVSARVADLRDGDPPAADIVGWTVSWLAGNDRVYAQAERASEGLVFRYGVREAESDAPVGPSFGGRATTGSLDADTGLVSIVVPRDLMPEDGARVSGMGATAWALTGRNTASVYIVWDETAPRTYLAGAVCAA